LINSIKIIAIKYEINLVIYLILISFLWLYGCSDQKNTIKTKNDRFISKFRKVDYSRVYNYKFSISKLFDSLKINTSLLRIEVDKSDYILSVFSDTLLIKQYPVVLGKNPINEKLQQGDNCTPEGTFKIKAKYEHKKWSKFIWLNYPTEESYLKIMKAKEAGIISKESSAGGDIGIHGVEEGFDYAIDYGINWTAGCVALKNKDINEIYSIVNNNTLIKIIK
jgi:murein L,D-transpeptidase YafK